MTTKVLSKNIIEIMGVAKVSVTQAKRIDNYLDENNIMDYSECSTEEYHHEIREAVRELALEKQIKLNRKNGNGNKGQVTLTEISKAEKQLLAKGK